MAGGYLIRQLRFGTFPSLQKVLVDSPDFSNIVYKQHTTGIDSNCLSIENRERSIQSNI